MTYSGSIFFTILLSARDAGDFNDAAGEREMAPECGSLPRDAGDLVGLYSVRCACALATRKRLRAGNATYTVITAP